MDGNRFESAVIADDHELFRGALADFLLREGVFSSVDQVASLDEALVRLERLDRVALLSIDSGTMMEQRERVAWICRAYPEMRVVVFASDHSSVEREAGVAIGVHGFISRASRSSQIREEIQMVLRGSTVRSTYMSERSQAAVSALRDHAAGSSLTVTAHRGLSRREIEVMRLLALGLSNKEIARHLNMAEGTVKVHVNAIYRLLNVHNRVSALLAMNRALASGADARLSGHPGPQAPGALTGAASRSDSNTVGSHPDAGGPVAS